MTLPAQNAARTLLALLALTVVLLALPSASAPLSFTVLGDWGLPIGYADKIASKSASVNASFFLGIGDNFYSKGVKSTTDKLWQTVYEKIYTAPIFQKPWYIIAGNHDHYGNVTAQIEYSKKSSRWIFPSLYYTRTVPLPEGGSVAFIFIDTCNIVDFKDEKQIPWIEEALAASANATWAIVVGHYPVYSVGSHGTTSLLVKKLAPLLTKYKVGAYINGHEHGLQYIRANDVSYITTGNVAKFTLQGVKKVPSEAIVDYYFPDSKTDIAACKIGLKSCYAFTTVQMTSEAMSFTMWRNDLKKLYSNVIRNPRAKTF